MSSVFPRELLPLRASFRPGEAIEIDIRGAVEPGTVTVWHLGDLAAEVAHDGGSAVTLPALPKGGYGVELGDLRTAIEVTANPRGRLRYGFVASYAPDKDVEGLADTVRRLHLTDVQFYDWAYRHADLMGGGETYRDALNQPISLPTVRSLIGAVQQAGARALGYTAVYAAGPNEWPRWQHDGLIDGAGKPHALGDFLFLLDPAAADWRAHYAVDLGKARALGFDGFHLDQYGYPKRAVRADGQFVDMGASFDVLIRSVREALPDAGLIFNNVNDFPTRLSATAPQDAVYIEIWEPQLTLDALARTVERARAFGGGKPVIAAAYQHVYDSATADEADCATALTMATLYSHGATQLLAGEADRILTDPYYVRNHKVAPSTARLLKRWYDFLVAHDELLMPAAVTDVTNCYAGAYNGDLDVSFPSSAPVTGTATAGAVWRRITEIGGRLVVHLINLCGQPDTLWDAPRAAPGDPGRGRVQFKCLHGRAPRLRVADPDGAGRLFDLPVAIENGSASADLPALGIWQMVVVDLDAG